MMTSLGEEKFYGSVKLINVSKTYTSSSVFHKNLPLLQNGLQHSYKTWFYHLSFQESALVRKRFPESAIS